MILDWRNKKERIQLLDEVIGKDIYSILADSKITGCWSDCLDWMPEKFNFSQFKDKFKLLYDGVKCFHACSPSDLNSYYKLGFTGGNQQAAINEFNSLFSDVDVSIRNKVSNQVLSSRNDEINKTFLLCDYQSLIEREGHYLIYGSEFLFVLAASLERYVVTKEDFRQRLKGRGIPTIFELNIPFNYLDEYQINTLLYNSLSEWGKYHFFPEEQYSSTVAVTAKEYLPPTLIVNHFHPSVISDKHCGLGAKYKNDKICPLCESAL